MSHLWSVFSRALRVLFTLLLTALLLSSSKLPPVDQVARVRAITHGLEFDYVTWTLGALGTKVAQLALGAADYLPDSHRSQIVLDYLDLVREIQHAQNRLNQIYADPGIANPEAASADLRTELQDMYARRDLLGPIAESVFQGQLRGILSEQELALGGQPIPPVLYRTTPLPLALIVSPREVIRQDANISLEPGMTLERRQELETDIDQSLDLSSLVVNIGGVGTYPTMVLQSSDINWLAATIAHEWTHNFLTLRPLGLSVFNSPELLTMNETTAGIAGREIGLLLVKRYYPQHVPPPPTPVTSSPENNEPPAFDFRAEMRTTRLNADQLLAEGKIEEAESYMEMRRSFFWENGYRLRKINQAYFAFYGSYADQPGGAAGDDPIGAAVRTLRSQSPSLAAFLKLISWITSPDQLFNAIQQNRDTP